MVFGPAGITMTTYSDSKCQGVPAATNQYLSFACFNTPDGGSETSGAHGKKKGAVVSTDGGYDDYGRRIRSESTRSDGGDGETFFDGTDGETFAGSVDGETFQNVSPSSRWRRMFPRRCEGPT